MNLLNVLVSTLVILGCAYAHASGGSAVVSRSGHAGPANADEYMIESNQVDCPLRDKTRCFEFGAVPNQPSVPRQNGQFIDPRQQTTVPTAPAPSYGPSYMRSYKSVNVLTAGSSVSECMREEAPNWDTEALNYLCAVDRFYRGCITKKYWQRRDATGRQGYDMLAQVFSECGVR